MPTYTKENDQPNSSAPCTHSEHGRRLETIMARPREPGTNRKFTGDQPHPVYRLRTPRTCSLLGIHELKRTSNLGPSLTVVCSHIEVERVPLSFSFLRRVKNFVNWRENGLKEDPTFAVKQPNIIDWSAASDPIPQLKLKNHLWNNGRDTTLGHLKIISHHHHHSPSSSASSPTSSLSSSSSPSPSSWSSSSWSPSPPPSSS